VRGCVAASSTRRVESFPSNLVAGRFGFAKADYFELESPSDRQLPEVRFA